MRSEQSPSRRMRTAALQARSRFPFPDSAGRAAREARLGASLTAEAALAFPLFLFAVYLLLLPLRMLDTSRRMLEICEDVCRTAAEAAYLTHLSTASSGEDPGGTAAVLPGQGPSGSEGTEASADKGQEDRDGAVSEAQSLSGNLKGNTLGLLAAGRVLREVEDPHVEHLNGLRSSYLADGETVRITLDYDYRLPFTVFGLGSLHQTVSAGRRAWLGKDGSGAGDGTDLSDSSGTIVYVGATSTRYHKSPHCHYLSNDLTACSYEEAKNARNSEGRRYAPCARCGSHASGGTVYLLPSGTVYHTDPECTAIIAYSRAVPLSEAEHLGPCSYCCGND